MKRFFTILSILVLSCCVFSCVQDDEGNVNMPGGREDPVFSVNEDDVVSGLIRIRLTENAEKQVNLCYTDEGIAQIGIEDIDNVARELGAIRIERTFRHGGKFEARRRAEGMHLWYNIYYDNGNTVTKAYNDFSFTDGVDMVEPAYKIIPIHTTNVISQQEAESMVAAKAAMKSGTRVAGSDFNDPYLDMQWHYSNDGSLGAEFLPGADVNVLKAWEITTGDPRVIVAIMDDGVAVTHPDLKDNVWVNTAERDGADGVDDDNNGFIDDLNGWNFVENIATIRPGDEHGTHVAGTVAAVNNNGIGVCGIAGGDYANGKPGVRIMSCQIIKENGVPASAATYEMRHDAYLYAADNGAVISQNSWTYGKHYTKLEETDRLAIDYFIKYAGIDENGVQVGPLEGGIVIFAGGNDFGNFKVFPGAYEAVLCVSSMGPAFERAEYSNYGTWIDITAPGGNDPTRGSRLDKQVYSTILNDQYGFQQGSSMACPHVSGVAALLVSKIGLENRGVSGKDIMNILTKTANPDLYTYNPSLANMLGTGYLDAYAALVYSPDGGTVPVQPSKVESDSYRQRIDLKITVAANGSNITPNRYQVFVADRDLRSENLENPSNDVSVFSVRTENATNGTVETLVVTNLKADTKYYFAVKALNISGTSAPVLYYDAVTVNFNPPNDVTDFKASWEDGIATIKWTAPEDPDDGKAEYYRIYYSKEDLINKDWSTIESSIHMEEIDAVRYPVNKEAKRTIKDLSPSSAYYFALISYDARTNASNPAFAKLFTGENKAPERLKELPKLTFTGVGASQTLNMLEYFRNDDSLGMEYVLTTQPNDYLSYTVENDIMTITSKSVGSGVYKIVARDYTGLSVEGVNDFSVGAGNAGGMGSVTVYPTTVTTVMTIDIADYKGGNVEVSIFSSSGAKVAVHTEANSRFTMDIRSLSSGIYTVVVKCGGDSVKRSITKL